MSSKLSNSAIEVHCDVNVNNLVGKYISKKFNGKMYVGLVTKVSCWEVDCF
jgi:hypothetical protein